MAAHYLDDPVVFRQYCRPRCLTAVYSGLVPAEHTDHVLPMTARPYQTPVSPGRNVVRAGILNSMTSAEQHDHEQELHLFTVDDPRLWEFRSRLSDEEFTIEGVSDDEWDAFHEIIASA